MKTFGRAIAKLFSMDIVTHNKSYDACSELIMYIYNKEEKDLAAVYDALNEIEYLRKETK